MELIDGGALFAEALRNDHIFASGFSEIGTREGRELEGPGSMAGEGRLSEQTMERLRETVPTVGSIAGNPLDAWRIFDDPEYLLEILGLAYADPNVSMVMVDRLVPRAAFHMTGDASLTQEVVDFVTRSQKPTVFTIDYDGGDAELTAKGTALRAELCQAGIPAYPSLRRAAWALSRLHGYHAHRAATA